MDHTPITVTIVSSVTAADDAGWDEGDLLHLAKQDGVLIDANDERHAAAFRISPYYVPQHWLNEVKARPQSDDD